MAEPTVPFGAAMRQTHFGFSPAYTPLNHGSYGTYPLVVKARYNALRDEAEAAPDVFIALDNSARLAEARSLTARLLRCGAEELVLVENATTAIDTVLRNLDWRAGDVVVRYELTYGAVALALDYVAERYGVDVRVLRPDWPLPDDELVRDYVAAVRAIRRDLDGRPVRLALVDTIVSVPGLRLPFERLVPALQAEGVMVLVDGAHGIGHIDLDLASLRPDFFVTNLHKWLFVPRACAALVVRPDRQHLIRSSVPTGHGFRPRGRGGDEANRFVDMFQFIGTSDVTNYLCVEAALSFRADVCGGEAAIREYCQSIVRRGASIAAEVLGSEVLDAAGSCMRQCNFANVRLPLDDVDDAVALRQWILRTGPAEGGVYFQVARYRDVWYWRLSGMIYVNEDDFRRGAELLKRICDMANRGEWRQPTVVPAGGQGPDSEQGLDGEQSLRG